MKLSRQNKLGRGCKFLNFHEKLGIKMGTIKISMCALVLGLINVNHVDASQSNLSPYNKWLVPASEKSDATVRRALGTNNLSGIEIIDLLSREYPGLKKLYDSDAQVLEGYSIREHTVMVCAQFEDQKRFFNLQQLDMKGVTDNIERLLRVSIALHDIGKSIGPKSQQHQHTFPLLQIALEKWGFTPREICLSTALVTHDIIGGLLKEFVSPQQAFRELADLACQVGIDLQTFFMLQNLFYISDASSYPALRIDIMTVDKEGKLLLKSSKFQELERLIATQSYVCLKSIIKPLCTVPETSQKLSVNQRRAKL